MNYLFKVPFGSQVYGMTNSKSDCDFVYIVKEGSDFSLPSNNDSEIINTTEFQKLLDSHDVKALETYFYSEEVQTYFSFNLNAILLRSAVSKVVSNSHVKAKKKFKDNEIYSGLKSYYHCIRILTMFTYLVKHNSFNPSEFKYELEYVYQDILSREGSNPDTLFLELEKDYKKMLKNLQHCFRMYCPKD